jgi:para-aminobenzoate synthetase/4-amino-4-deoxychorismate lyase
MYQVNFTLRRRFRLTGDPRAYRDLCGSQPAPFAPFDTGRFKLLSASPELFFRLGMASSPCGR